MTEPIAQGPVDVNVRHRCAPGWAEDDKDRFDGYGPAVTECHESEDGTLWVGNCEYGTQVNFCPFCGYEAQTTVPNAETPAGAASDLGAGLGVALCKCGKNPATDSHYCPYAKDVNDDPEYCTCCDDCRYECCSGI